MSQIGLNSWTTGDGSDAVSDIQAAGCAGFDLLELRDAKIEQHLAGGGDLDDLARRARDEGLSILSVSTLDDATLPTGADLTARVERCRIFCSWAQALDAPVVIVAPSYFSGEPLAAEHVRERSAAALARYAAVATEHGVRIAFEFHGYERCSINTLSGARAIIGEIGGVGLLVDAFHFYVGNSSLEDLEALPSRMLFAVHVADVDHGDRATLGKSNRVLPGDGVLPLGPLMAAIGQTGYDGPYSLELFRPDYWAMEPLTVARLGLAGMRRFVPKPN